jgi:hypothetical protein
MLLPPQTLASPVGTCSTSSTAGVPTVRWLKAIIGWSNVLITTCSRRTPQPAASPRPRCASHAAPWLLLAALGHALDFQTWRSLVRQQGLDDEQAVELMVKMVRCAIRG